MPVVAPPPLLPVPVPYSTGIVPLPVPVRMSTWKPQRQAYSIGSPDGNQRDSTSSVSESDEGSDSERSDDEVYSDFDLQGFRRKFRRCLSRQPDMGSFAYWNDDLTSVNPDLTVHDSGCVTLPTYKAEAERLIGYASKPPYGKGTETLIDESVRKTWEIDAKDIKIESQLPAQRLANDQRAQWDRWIEELLINVKKGLGLKTSTGIKAELYKMLIYGKGAHFKPHRDTEKAPGMFGTMVIGLPSEHEGGDIRLLHEKDERCFSTSARSGFSCAAWFSDVLHEVKPVTSGYRVVLTYNLIEDSSSAETIIAPIGSEQELTELVEGYARAAELNKRLPSEMIYRLSHKYTETSLSIDELKPNDFAIAKSLQNAAKGSCKLYLALLEREQKGGTAEGEDPDEWEHMMSERDDDEDDSDESHSSSSNGDDGQPGRFERPSRPQTFAEHEIVETMSHSITLKDVHELGGDFLVDEIEADKKSFVQNMYKYRAPDEEDWSGFTGNEGCSATHWYHDSVLVLIPNKFALTFEWGPNLGNAAEALPNTLDHLVRQIKAGDRELLTDLAHVCDVAIYKELENKVYMAKTPLLSRAKMAGETKGSIARSCAMMGNLRLFKLAMTLFDRHTPISAYRGIGEMFEFTDEDLFDALQSVDIACGRIAKKTRAFTTWMTQRTETQPAAPHHLFEAFHGLCESYKATHADENGKVHLLLQMA